MKRTTTKTTEITVEREVRVRASIERRENRWCPACGRKTAVMTLDEVRALAGSDADLSAWLNRNSIHARDVETGLICVDSLCTTLKNFQA